MFRKTSLSIALPLAIGLTVAGTGCGSNDPEPMNLVETALDSGDFQTLSTALRETGLDETLAASGPYTVFAPTDAAFDALAPGALDDLLANTSSLEEVLLYHVVSGSVGAADLEGLGSATTLQGQPVFFDLSSGVKVNGANVVSADIGATNGIIHAIDAVLLPPSNNVVAAAAAVANLSTLVTAITVADLAATLEGQGPFTVFAPTNAAFDALPPGTLDALLEDPDALADILLYHVVPGRAFAGDLDGSALTTAQGATVTVDVTNGVQINEARVTTANVLVTNGVIHIIDAVLIPPTE